MKQNDEKKQIRNIYFIKKIRNIFSCKFFSIFHVVHFL